MPALSAGDGVPRDSQLEHLELRIYDRKSALIASAVERLLCYVGRSLVSLRVLSWRPSATLKPSLAAAIVKKYPNLEELTVRNAEDDFVQQLVDSYATHLCRLRRLALDVEYDGLLAALSTPEHSLSRTLCSLHMDVRGWDDEDVNALRVRFQQMLRANDRLRDLTLCVSPSWESNDDTDDADCEWSVQLPPLRHRLATLSVLRACGLPVPISPASCRCRDDV